MKTLDIDNKSTKLQIVKKLNKLIFKFLFIVGHRWSRKVQEYDSQLLQGGVRNYGRL